MNKTKKAVLLGIVLSMCFTGYIAARPVAASAESIELQGVIPALDEDITPPDNQKAEEENFYTFWFKGQIGTEYQVNFTVSAEPAFTFVSGGNMSVENAIHYNAETETFTVTYTAEKLEQIDSQSSLALEDGQTLTIVAVSFPVAEGENGPGADSVGSWISTNFQEWSLTTPSGDSNVMGARVRGDAGDTGQFKLFMSQTSVDAMAQNDNAEAGEYTGEDLALYADGDIKPKKDIQDVAGGGALLNFNATIPEESEESTEGQEEGSSEQSIAGFSAQSGQGSSLSIEVGPKPAVTLHTDKESVKQYRYVTLTGKIKSGLEGKTVKLLRRTIDTDYTVIKSTVTKKNGKFSFRVKIREMSGFQAKFKKQKSTEVSVTLK